MFISYSRIDRLYVEKLAGHLAGAGIPVWYDMEVTAGERFAKEVSDRIRGCSAFVVVLSPYSCASEWVGRELHYAVEQDKVILPLLLAPCEVPIQLSGVHYEDVVGGRPVNG